MSRRKKILLLAGAGLVVAYVVFDIVAGWRLARTVHRLERQHGSFELRALAPKKIDSPGANQALMFRAAAEIVTLERAQRKLLTDAVLDPEAILRDPRRVAELPPTADRALPRPDQPLDAGARSPKAPGRRADPDRRRRGDLRRGGDRLPRRPGARPARRPPSLSVPIAALVVWLLVVRGSYRNVEKVFLDLGKRLLESGK